MVIFTSCLESSVPKIYRDGFPRSFLLSLRDRVFYPRMAFSLTTGVAAVLENWGWNFHKREGGSYLRILMITSNAAEKCKLFFSWKISTTLAAVPHRRSQVMLQIVGSCSAHTTFSLTSRNYYPETIAACHCEPVRLHTWSLALLKIDGDKDCTL